MTRKPASLESSLRNISSTAQHMKDMINLRYGCSSHASDSSYTESIPQLHLPFPNEALSALRTLSLPDQTSQKCILLFSQAIRELQLRHSNSYEKTCRRLLETTKSKDRDGAMHHLSGLRDAIQYSYHHHYLPLIRKQIQDLFENLHKHVANTKRTPFNNDFVPLLEQYFQRNPYPSTSERSKIARQSKMTPRQIEVWFQNHRNRAKKDGLELRRPKWEASSPSPQFLESETSISEHEKDNRSNMIVESGVSGINEASPRCTAENFLNVPRSPMAYPTHYVPFKRDFTNNGGECTLNIPTPFWSRTVHRRPVSINNMDLDGLVEAISRSQIKSRPVKRNDQCQESKSENVPCQRSRSSFRYAIPSSALLNAQSLSPLLTSQSLTTVRGRYANLTKHSPRHAKFSITPRSRVSSASSTSSSDSASSFLPTPSSSPSTLSMVKNLPIVTDHFTDIFDCVPTPLQPLPDSYADCHAAKEALFPQSSVFDAFLIPSQVMVS